MISSVTPDDPTTVLRGEWAPEFVERIRGLDGIHFDHAGPSPEAVNAFAALAEPMGPDEPGDLIVDDVIAPGPHGDVPVRSYVLRDESQRARTAFVWIHGGGFIGGDLDQAEADAVARGIAIRTGSRVLSVDYRLCVDGVHHPVPHDDCWAVLRWAGEKAAEWGVDPSLIAVGGASAGANLAASVALRARDEGVALGLALLIYPYLHPVLAEPDAELAACLAQTPPSILFPRSLMTMLNENFLGGPESTAVPLAFPGLASDLTGFAPSYVEACEFDELRTSAQLFAEQLSEAAVPVEYVVAAGVPHGHLGTIGSPYALATLDRMAARIDALGGSR